jgi:hypothetical protein
VEITVKAVVRCATSRHLFSSTAKGRIKGLRAQLCGVCSIHSIKQISSNLQRFGEGVKRAANAG